MRGQPPKTMDAQAAIAVIGAGPAGLMAAIAAAGSGARVIVLEQLARPGVKLLATGGGRCNLTNLLPSEECMRRFGRNGRFMRDALKALDAAGLREFFERLGVASHSTDGFHVFPKSESAADVQRALSREAEGRGARLLTGSRVTGITSANGAITGVETTAGPVPATRVILATGGLSYPDLGATGTGFELARALGHSLVAPVPALVPLLTAEKWMHACAGITLPEIEAWIDLPEYARQRTAGPLLFTHCGLSGPAILDLSGAVATLLCEKAPVPLRLNLTPGTGQEAWAQRLDEWRGADGRKQMRTLLDRHFPAGLASGLATAAGAGDVQASRLSREQRLGLLERLTRLPVTVVGTEGFSRAIVTRGGVSLKEVSQATLESRLLRGLFFAGEVLDLDGPCGGFNLQWAFSSGRLAGLSAAAASK